MHRNSRLVFLTTTAALLTPLLFTAFAPARAAHAQATHRGPTAGGQSPNLAASAQQAAPVPLNGQPSAQNPAQTATPGAQTKPPTVAPAPFRGMTQPVRTPPNAQLADKDLNEKVDKLLKELSLEEKIGQLAQYSGGTATGPGTGLTDFDTLISEGRMGSLFNVTGAKETNRYQRLAMEKSPHKIPLIFGLDIIHGYRTEFPVPLAMASSWDPEIVKQAAHTAAAEAAAEGVRWTFSPMVDVSRDARWGRIVESAGEDPFLGSAFARAYVQGYQGKSLSDPTSIAACVKHFAAYGAAEAGRDYNTTDMSEYTLRGIYLPPYKAAIDAGVATVMSAFNSLNGVPSTANPYTLFRILRREWNFQGFVVSDWSSIKELEAHGIANDDATAAYKAFAAGVDMDMQSNLYNKELPEIFKSGKIPQPALDEAVRRILRVKFALGLFDHPYADENLPTYTATAEKREQARKTAEESIVLLKNHNSVLPLRKDLKTVALIGPLADSQQDMMGSWGGKGNAADAITLRAALQQRLGDKAKLVYAQGSDITGNSDAGFKDAIKAAKSADVVILALGEKADTQTGEAASRAHLEAPGSENQQRLLEAVATTGKPIVLVLFNGHPLALTKSEPLATAIVEAWYPGIEAGNAVANLLYGDVNFSAKLPVSMPRSVGQEPLYYAQLPTGRPAGADVDLSVPPTSDTNKTKYISRYIDEQNSPLYPFGYGLSYTTFSYSQPTVSIPSVLLSKLMTPRGMPTDEHISVGVDVKNTGSVAGTEVAQLYLRVTGASTEQPVRMLRGFERVTLAPGESKHVDFKLGFDELAFVTMRNQVALEPVHYDIYVGESSQAANHVEFKIEADPRPAPPKPIQPGAAVPAPATGTGTPLPPLIPQGVQPMATPPTQTTTPTDK
jgi:beta-glucosidase